ALWLRPDLFQAGAVREGGRVLAEGAAGEPEHGRVAAEHRRYRTSAARKAGQNDLDVVLRGRVGVDGTAGKEALQVVAAAVEQHLFLHLGLDALGDHLEAERVAKPYDGGDHRVVIGILVHIGDERAVDLERIQREAAQVRHTRKPDAEVVQRKAHADFLQLAQRHQREIRMLHDGRLGNLQLEQLWRQFRFLEQASDHVEQPGIVELSRREI